MIDIYVTVTHRVYKIPRREACDVGNHVSQQSVAGNVEWDAKTLFKKEKENNANFSCASTWTNSHNRE